MERKSVILGRSSAVSDIEGRFFGPNHEEVAEFSPTPRQQGPSAP